MFKQTEEPIFIMIALKRDFCDYFAHIQEFHVYLEVSN